MLQEVSSIGSRLARATTRPVVSVAGVAAETGINLERRAVDRLLDSGELGRLLDSSRLQAIVEQVLTSRGAQRLVDTLFETDLLDRLVERLLESDALWHLVDEIAASPAVTAAISQQGLGFADQVGEEVRGRSRRADDWLERSARRLVHRRSAVQSGTPEPTADEPPTGVS